MRICMFTDSFLPRISGVSYAVINQANELVRRGHDVMIFRPRPPRSSREAAMEEIHPDIEIRDVPLSIPDRRFPDLHIAVPTLLPSWKAVREFQPDIIHVHTEWGCGVEGLVSSRLENIPLFGTFHTFFADPQYLKHFCMPDTRLTRKMMWKYAVGFFNRCDAVIAPSRSVKTHLLANGLQAPAVVMSNGIEDPGHVPDRLIAERRAAAGLDSFNYIYIGRISSEKSLDQLLRAFRIVHGQHRGSRMIFVGGGNEEASLRTLTRNLGLDDAVTWMGSIPHHALISEAIPLLGDVFVTASKTENQPVSMLEAMSFGLPLIGPRAKGIPELIDHNVNGLLFQPDDIDGLADCMMILQTRPDTHIRMKNAALMQVREHCLGHIVNRLEDMYLLASHRNKLRLGRRIKEHPHLHWILRRRKRAVAEA